MIEVVLAGTGGMMPLPERWLSVALVRSGGVGVLFDCGEGTQIALREAGTGFRGIDAVCISHFHADHVSGLAGFLLMLANASRKTPVDIYGPPGLGAVVAGQRLIARFLSYDLRVHELWPGESFTVGPFAGSCALADHGTPCLAYRLDLHRRPRFLVDRARELGIPVWLWWRLQNGESVESEGRLYTPEMVLGPERDGLSIVYATDTRPAESVLTLALDADLLICEATFGDDADGDRARETRHMTFREAANLARAAKVKQLVLTHFSPALRDPWSFRGNAAEVFPSVVVGTDALRMRLPFRPSDLDQTDD